MIFFGGEKTWGERDVEEVDDNLITGMRGAAKGKVIWNGRGSREEWREIGG